MKAFLPLFALMLSFSQAAPISKITTLRGKTYRQCEIVKVHPDGVSFTHAAGAAKVLFTDLSKEWRSRLGYDADKAALYQKELAAARHQRLAARAKSDLEQTRAMAELEQRVRMRDLGLAAQARAAQLQAAANAPAVLAYPVLPALGAVHDSRGFVQRYATPFYGSPWLGGFFGGYSGGYSGFGFGGYTPYCAPPSAYISPPIFRRTIIIR